jgi:membrane-associated protease RseP (regulator of RpoE activity)
MSIRAIALAGLILLCAVPVAGSQEPPAASKVKTKSRNGGYLGIFVRETANGAMRIERLHPGCGAERAGLKAGDLVLSVDGRTITNGDQLIGRMWSSRPFTLRIRRGDAELDITTSTKALDTFSNVGDSAPRFALPKRDGSGMLALDDLLVKGKPVVLVFGSFT